MSQIYPVILSGGVGSRLWPLSRSLYPKQLLPLASEQSLIQETALRTFGPGFAKPIIVCHTTHRFLVAEQMRAVGIVPDSIYLEPIGRNTAPAAAVAALAIAEKDPDAVLLLLPADHVIRDREAMHKAIDIALSQAKLGQLVTFGVHPSGPETGYGYIQRGAPLRKGAFAVRRFVEKPDPERARQYIKEGDYYWNSGIFAFRAATYLSELERLSPQILARCRDALSRGTSEAGCIRLESESFRACKAISIDYAVMERTDRAAIVPVEMGWNDVGSWAALWDNSPKDAEGNATVGKVFQHGARNSYLRSDGPLIAALGIENLIVVASSDAVLVGSKSSAQDVKKIVDQLEREGSELQITHRKVQHSWGWSERISKDQHFEVDLITLNVGAKRALSAGHEAVGRWVVASGIARITTGDQIFHLRKNESHILSGEKHLLENVGETPLSVIELWVGSSRSEIAPRSSMDCSEDR